MSTPNYVAGGNIYPSRFVKASTAADFRVLQATANDRIAGISGIGTNYPPIVDPAITVNGYHAVAGQNCRVHGENDECLLELGSGGVTRGGLLKSDADGKGVAVATSGTTKQFPGARALESGSEGDKIRVEVLVDRNEYPALA